MGINLRVPQNSVKVDGRNSSIYLAQNAIKGDDGGYYIPSLDSEGNLTWAPSEVEMPAVGGANIKGPKGDSGVWVGTETPDGDYNVWVKPDDEAIEIATKADLDGKQDKLIAGTNITIENNVISASGGGSDEVWIGAEEPTGDQTVWIDPTGSETAGLVTQAELANKQDKLTAGTNITIDANNVISASGGSYTLPVANSVVLGGVKVMSVDSQITDADKHVYINTTSNLLYVQHATSDNPGVVLPDNKTITIKNGVISATGPAQYVSSAKVNNNTLTLNYNNGTSINFTPTGGSGGSAGVSGYAFSSTQIFTDVDKAHLKEIYNNRNTYMTIDYLTVVRIMSLGSRWGFVVINTNGATSNQVLVYTVNIDSSGNVTSNTFTLFMSYYLAGNSSALNGDIITSENWSQYITAGGGDWNSTTDNTYSDLYNAKELLVKLVGDASAILFFYGYFPDGLGNNTNNYYLLPGSTSVSNGYLQYNGSSLDVWNSSNTIDTIYYKT